MNICIDARWIFPEISGIGTYTQELVRHIARQDVTDSFTLLFGHQEVKARTYRFAQLTGHPNFSHHQLSYGPFSWKSQVLLPGFLKSQHLDIYHSPNYMIPFRAFSRRGKRRTRCVITIHDLIPLIFPDHAPRSKKTRLFPIFKRIMLDVGARADLIITVSESSRRDIIEHLRITPDREDGVVVIPEGVGEDYQPVSRPPREEKLILYVGRQDPYKNVVRLIEALARVREGSVPRARLRIIGPPDPRYPEPMVRARELGVMDAITWSGYVSGEELISAYQEADVFVLPSRYEGFGLPVLESMASGTPVICSNRSSLPEVAGDAALMIDPDEPDELSGALGRVLTDPALAESLRVRGLHRSAQFTWERTARETLQAYHRVMGM